MLEIVENFYKAISGFVLVKAGPTPMNELESGLADMDIAMLRPTITC